MHEALLYLVDSIYKEIDFRNLKKSTRAITVSAKTQLISH